jgi:hypothetical protein
MPNISAALLGEKGMLGRTQTVTVAVHSATRMGLFIMGDFEK